MGLLFHNLKKALRHPEKVPPFLLRKFRETFLWEHYYAALPEPKQIAPEPDELQRHAEIVAGLKSAGIVLHPYSIDLNDFQHFRYRAEYENYSDYYAGGRAPNFLEKALEHYLAAKVLRLSPGDIYLDIASGHSPAPKIYEKLFGCKSYSQDLIFPQGLRGNEIGGDATHLPLENRFATKMALHCSFEHLEGEADIDFLREASRVLRPGGKLCILPLYFSTKYVIYTDPLLVPKSLRFDADAALYAKKGYGNRFGRVYDVPHFLSRIRNSQGDLALNLYVVQNEKEIDRSCYVKFVALLTKA